MTSSPMAKKGSGLFSEKRPDPFLTVLVCHNYYQLPGGEDRVFEDEANLLEEHGHRVIRYTRRNDDVRSLGRLRTAQQSVWNRRTHREVRELIARERPDVMHCTNGFPLISPSAYYAARAAGVPVIQTLQNYRLLCPASVLMRDGEICEDCVGKSFAWPGVIHGCYRGSRIGTACVAGMLTIHRMAGTWRRAVSRYVVATEFGRQKFIEGGIRASQIAVKPNFVSPAPPPGRGAGKYFAFVGRLAPEKGIDTLLEAWSRCNVPLKILGDGPLAGRVARFAEQHDSVEWLGQQPGETVLSVIGDAIALVVPSIWYEGLPKTVIEAFSVGTPLVASNLGAMAEAVEPEKTGWLFTPGSADQLLAVLQSIAGAPDRATAMRPAVREVFESRYTADRNYQMLVDIYREAIQETTLRRF